MKPCVWTLFCVATAATSYAGPLTVTESTFGDFANNLPATALGGLGVGINTITGSLSPGGDRDYFSVSNPDGLAVDSITILVSNINNLSFNFASLGLLPPNSGTNFFNLDGTSNTFELPLTITDGTSLTLLVASGASPFFHFDYTVQIDASAPEPGTALLLIIGVIAIIATAYRRRQVGAKVA